MIYLRTRPKYGWKIVNHKIVPDDEWTVIEIIRYILNETPTISLAAIIRRLGSIKNIIKTNRL